MKRVHAEISVELIEDVTGVHVDSFLDGSKDAITKLEKILLLPDDCKIIAIAKNYINPVYYTIQVALTAPYFPEVVEGMASQRVNIHYRQVDGKTIPSRKSNCPLAAISIVLRINRQTL